VWLAAKFEGVQRKEILNYTMIEFIEIIEQVLTEMANG
jgi:hypothetical protein